MKHLLFFAKRYLFSKSENNAINIIVYIASLGVFFASMAFIIVLSGFSGIRTFNLNLIELTNPEIKILPIKGKHFAFNDSIENILNSEKNIQNYSKVLSEKVFLSYNNKQKIAIIKGVDDNFYKIIPLDSTIFIGQKPDYKLNELLVGVGLANDLGVMISSGNNPQVVKIIVPKPGKGIVSDPRKAFHSKYFFPTGVYQTSSDHDNTYIYTSINQVQDLLDFNQNEISQIEIKLKNKKLIDKTINNLKNKLGKSFKILNRQEQNPLIFRMLNTENLMTYFILVLILLLALFNVIGTLIMIVIDKADNIKTLKILGLKISEIRKIFMIQGVSMTLISGFAGLLIGIILVYIQMKKPFLFIPQANMPYPVEIHFINISAIVFTLFVLSLFSTTIAVRRIK